MLKRKLSMLLALYSKASELVKEFFGNPLEVFKGLAENLVDYKVYGNSEQIEGFDYDLYEPLEYIESSGTQYIIDENVDLTDVYNVEAEVSFNVTKAKVSEDE